MSLVYCKSINFRLQKFELPRKSSVYEKKKVWHLELIAFKVLSLLNTLHYLQNLFSWTLKVAVQPVTAKSLKISDQQKTVILPETNYEITSGWISFFISIL